MTGQVYVQATQPISQPAGPAFAVPVGAAGTVLTSQGVDQSPVFSAAAGSVPGGAANAVQYNSAGAFGGVGPGNARQVLTTATNGAAPSWLGASGCRVTNSVNQGAAGSLTAITFDTETFDTDAYHSGVNPSRLIAPFSGYYDLMAGVQFGAGGFIVIDIQFNGSGLQIASFAPSLNVGGSARFVLGCPFFFTAGQYAEVLALNTGGGNIDAANGCPWFSMMFRGA